MKILKITYKKIENDEYVNDVSFNRNGISVVLGKIEDRLNLKDTTNGVGKSIIMKTINYIYGSNSDESLYSKLSDFYFEAEILIKESVHTVKRFFKQNGQILFDGNSVSLDEYKKIININRGEISKLLLLAPRNKVAETPGVTYNANDLTIIFQLLGLDKLSQLISGIKSKKDEISETSKAKTQILDVMGVDAKQIENRRIKNKTELEQIRIEEEAVKEKIKTLSINEINDGVQREFEIDNQEIKKLRRENYNYDSELGQLNHYLELSSNFAITTSDIERIYEEAGVFLQKELITTLSDAETFYKQIVEDRKVQIAQRIKAINSLIEQNNIRINLLNRSLSEKSAILSKNDIFQNSVLILSDLQNKIDELLIESGRLEHYSKIIIKEEQLKAELAILYRELTEEQLQLNNVIEGYKKFIFKASKRLYKEDEATLTIDFKDYSLRGLPVSIDISLRKEDSDGVAQVKNALFDYLLFSGDTKNEIMLHDSSCFSDVDTRQIATLLTIGNEIALKKDKQYIVSINGYDIHDSAQSFIREKIVIELSENNPLLKQQL